MEKGRRQNQPNIPFPLVYKLKLGEVRGLKLSKIDWAGVLPPENDQKSHELCLWFHSGKEYVVIFFFKCIKKFFDTPSFKW